jgi:hypothetical protein
VNFVGLPDQVPFEVVRVSPTNGAATGPCKVGLDVWDGTALLRAIAPEARTPATATVVAAAAKTRLMGLGFIGALPFKDDRIAKFSCARSLKEGKRPFRKGSERPTAAP